MRTPQLLANASSHCFRATLEAAKPALLPRAYFREVGRLPAITKWFAHHGHHSEGESPNVCVNAEYLTSFEDTVVSVEISKKVNTPTSHTSVDEDSPQFARRDIPFHAFLSLLNAANSPEMRPSYLSTNTIYLAQHSISALPHPVQSDLPTPSLIQQASKGDIYASSVWLGLSPTFTPLHKDPNPNLFVQLAGRKRVRLFEPMFGEEIYRGVRSGILSTHASGGALPGSSAIRDEEEMMQGPEREELERVTWGEDKKEVGNLVWEAELGIGDGLFVPKGWWHSLKSAGVGVNGSVNWWFR